MWGDKTTVPVPQDWYREGGLCGKGVVNKEPCPRLSGWPSFGAGENSGLGGRLCPHAVGTRVWGSFGGFGNNVERPGVGEEQVKRNSAGDRGDYVCDPVRKGTKRAKEAPEMSSGGIPPTTTWDSAGLATGTHA